MTWQQRERLLYWGSALAIGPALAFLPAMALAEVTGIFKLTRGCVEHPFNLLSWLSFGVMLVLMVIATYTGVFLVALATRM